VVASLDILTVGATPLSLSAAKEHLRVDHTTDDNTITAYLRAAFDMAERRTGRAYREQTAVLYLDEFPSTDDPIYLPRPPLRAITSIQYTDTSGNAQTLASNLFEMVPAAVPGQVIPVNGQSWPSALARPGSVRITFACGNAAKCPDVVLNAVRLEIDHLYHEHTPVESVRISDRFNDLIRSELLRDPNLSGIRT
jgi:uncharacterized phiE125 gp8 family phage protein